MKISNKNFILLAAVFIMLSIIAGGCNKQKGCMDKNALNYNVAAEADDGSCVYCQTSTKVTGSNIYFLRDYNSSGTHYNQQVAEFFFTETQVTSNSQKCGGNSCNMSLKIQNRTTNPVQAMSFQVLIEVFGNTGAVIDTVNADIPGGQTKDFGVISTFQNTGSSGNCGTPSYNVFNTPIITYH